MLLDNKVCCCLLELKDAHFFPSVRDADMVSEVAPAYLVHQGLLHVSLALKRGRRGQSKQFQTSYKPPDLK